MKHFKMRRLLSSFLVTTLFLSGCGLFGESDTETDSENAVNSDENLSDESGSDEPSDEATDEENSEDDEAEIDQDLTVWFPKLENTLLDYKGDGNEFAPFTRYPQFVKEDSLQMVESTAGTDVVTVYNYSDDEIKESFVRAETYFREDFVDTGLESEQGNFQIILQKPLELGHSWESPDGSTSEITDVSVNKDLPLGSIEAIEVTRQYENNSETIDYYGKDIGLIEQIFKSDDDTITVTSTLSTQAADTPEAFPITVYSIDDQALGLDKSTVTMELETNEPARLAMAEILKGQTPDTEESQILKESTEINFMYLRQDGVVHVDFSTDLSAMNAGSGIEAMTLQGIVNTIGDYYHVDEVLLTLDNEPYESGHILLNEGETWPVDYGNVNQ
ncbi:Sporulation and spore germination [Alkalibacterium gilvum]|uniref:Sporulation and spore germination n=2 Tax=Alkalibacterium gilvum TaxID=1130080 RepID=A0A1H6RFB2_9LACT|nr:GerMN domain-containing protein [Alkalibacterium gilvum]SEI53126.1 Sporulation and spore germination [Alkalibacterium gilvum]